MIYIHVCTIDYLCSAATVVFSQSLYSIREDSGFMQLELLLSNPSSFNVAIELFSTNGSAAGNQYTILCMWDNLYNYY